jgi:acylglycerol lipase
VRNCGSLGRRPMITSTNVPAIETYPARDGRRLALRVWKSAGPPRARVVFLHGIISHGGWYEQLAIHLQNAGFDVHFLDRRGSGLNPEQPGDVESWRTLIDDVAEYLRSFGRRSEVDAEPDRLPVVLCGISWGGKLAAAVARLHPALLDALALICPGIYSPYMPGVLKRALLAIPVPGGIQQQRLRIPLRRPELFTNSPHWQQFIAEDPYALRTITWRFAQQDRHLTDFARKSAPFIHCPMLMMLAGEDQILDNEMCRQFFSQVAGSRKTLIEYPAAAHTLEFEHDSGVYFADLTDWISQIAQKLAANRSPGMAPC